MPETVNSVNTLLLIKILSKIWSIYSIGVSSKKLVTELATKIQNKFFLSEKKILIREELR